MVYISVSYVVDALSLHVSLKEGFKNTEQMLSHDDNTYSVIILL